MLNYVANPLGLVIASCIIYEIILAIFNHSIFRLQVDVLKKKASRNSDIGLPSANQKEIVTLRCVQGRTENDEQPKPDSSSSDCIPDQVNIPYIIKHRISTIFTKAYKACRNTIINVLF